jgi:hypothetical protein
MRDRRETDERQRETEGKKNRERDTRGETHRETELQK